MKHLADEWLRTARRAGARDDVAGAGARLLSAYGDPARRYHGLAHLDDVLRHVDDLALHAIDPDAVRVAAWFHDAVYDSGASDNEERSAVLAERMLASLRVPAARIAEIARLVRLTATHEVSDSDANGAVLCDADLAVLAREPKGYAAYTQAVREEFAAVPDLEFRDGRARILRALLSRPSLFRTPYAVRQWEHSAQANLQRELAELNTPGGEDPNP